MKAFIIVAHHSGTVATTVTVTSHVPILRNSQCRSAEPSLLSCKIRTCYFSFVEEERIEEAACKPEHATSLLMNSEERIVRIPQNVYGIGPESLGHSRCSRP